MRTHGLTKDATYKVWQSMWQRCINPNCESYKDYGGRGIGIDPEWKLFQNFIRDMGLSPPGATIDRINNDLGYAKDNCRWSSPEIQNQNRRGTRLNAELVREIRRRVSTGERGRDVARDIGVSEQTVSMVVNGHTWKNVA